jgi:hypothetical protein
MEDVDARRVRGRAKLIHIIEVRVVTLANISPVPVGLMSKELVSSPQALIYRNLLKYVLWASHFEAVISSRLITSSICLPGKVCASFKCLSQNLHFS